MTTEGEVAVLDCEIAMQQLMVRRMRELRFVSQLPLRP